MTLLPYWSTGSDPTAILEPLAGYDDHEKNAEGLVNGPDIVILPRWAEKILWGLCSMLSKANAS